MLFFRHSKYQRKLLISAGVALALGVTSFFFFIQKQESANQTEWATYSVNVPAFTEEMRGEIFSFQYPKSEYIQMKPDTFGRLLRFQNYDPYTTLRTLDDRYRLEFFIDTDGHITCEENVVNATTITNSQGTTMRKGQARQNPESGDGGTGIAACIERSGYVLYMQGSDETGEGIVEKMIDSIQY